MSGLTALSLVVLVICFAVGLASEVLMRKTDRRLDQTYEQGRSVGRDARAAIARGVDVGNLPRWDNPWAAALEPLELRREKLRTRLELWTGTRTLACIGCVISGGYLLSMYIIHTTFPYIGS